MLKSTKSRAENLLAASLREEKQFLKEKEDAQQERVEGVEKLRALRLAKKAAVERAAAKMRL